MPPVEGLFALPPVAVGLEALVTASLAACASASAFAFAMSLASLASAIPTGVSEGCLLSISEGRCSVRPKIPEKKPVLLPRLPAAP